MNNWSAVRSQTGKHIFDTTLWIPRRRISRPSSYRRISTSTASSCVESKTCSLDGNVASSIPTAILAKPWGRSTCATFPPEAEARTLDMVRRIEDAMAKRIRDLDWMSPETKRQALEKLTGIRNKIGHPEKWRDYSSVRITRDDFRGNIANASSFERHRQISKVGKPVDRGEWHMTP